MVHTEGGCQANAGSPFLFCFFFTFFLKAGWTPSLSACLNLRRYFTIGVWIVKHIFNFSSFYFLFRFIIYLTFQFFSDLVCPWIKHYCATWKLKQPAKWFSLARFSLSPSKSIPNLATLVCVASILNWTCPFGQSSFLHFSNALRWQR